MANPEQRFQLLILAAQAADAEAVLAVLKRARLPVRGAFSQNPRSLVRASHSDLALACIGESVPAAGVAAAYADIDQRIPLIVIAPPGTQDTDALLLLRAGAQGLLAPGDEAALLRVVQREWRQWNLARHAEALQERLKRSEAHLQALLKAGVDAGARAAPRASEQSRIDPAEACRALTGSAEGSPVQARELMDLLPPEYREALEPLLADPARARATPRPAISTPGRAVSAAPALEPLALQPASEPAGELPPLALATSEEPLPPLAEQPRAISGRQLSDDELIEQIERALHNDGFKLAYQPIVSLRGDSQERYSVLLRLLDDQHGFRAADDLLEPAARSGRLPDVDRWVIQHALIELSARHQAGHRAHFLLSLSAPLLQDPDLLIWICDQLRQHSIRGSWVSFQMQEDDVRALPDFAGGLAGGLRQVKSRVVVAGFGRNTDSELLLDSFPMDFVRLAPSLTEGIGSDPLKQHHVSHLLEVAGGRGIKTIAGCIEDERALAAIWSAGGDYVQGKLIGRPSSAFELND